MAMIGRGRGALKMFPVPPSSSGRGARTCAAAFQNSISAGEDNSYSGGESSVTPVPSEQLRPDPDPPEKDMLDIRVTEVMDPASFWAQIGKGS